MKIDNCKYSTICKLYGSNKRCNYSYFYNRWVYCYAFRFMEGFLIEQTKEKDKHYDK